MVQFSRLPIVLLTLDVPDFLFPRATKEEFITESDIAFHDFYDRCKIGEQIATFILIFVLFSGRNIKRISECLLGQR